MAEFKCLSWLLTCTYLICVCNCQDSIVSVIQKMDQFEEDLFHNKEDMIRMEKRIRNIIDVAETSLRAELKENIRDQVREAMAEILQGESLQDMVKSQVVSELRHLKQGYHQMKRQLLHVSRSLKDFQDESGEFHESVLKKADVWNRENSSDTCVRDKHRLEIELRNRDICAADLQKNIERFMVLNETCQSQISQLKTALAVPASSPAPVNVTSTPKSPVSTTSVTTPRPEEERSRILIAPGWSSTQHQFRQLNIHNNSLSVYQYHTMKRVTCVAFVAKTKKLLIGLWSPVKIMSSTLDTIHVAVLREGVHTYGMAVDEDRDIVFIAADKPQMSISRMSTQGKDFTAIIDLSKYGSNTRQISLDTRRKRIYGCNHGKLFTMTYDGQGLATLATGSRMYAVTLDQTAGVLYYSIEKKLMKMTVSTNVSTEVTTLSAFPWNMRLYRGTIYFSCYSSPIVGAVDVTYNTVAYTLKSLSMKGAGALLMCLIP
ncbi:uncharacterized protein LOC125382926 [Haliotis rufescens]|uniref:uncharacterized protein LOC125382926 n=1 Tax=Haliotis rufescens TaxID=6454 RepID=UPI00201F8749|nr:uncharacterized protein LOC125382926 [Haliotis rufescens]